MHRDVVTHVAVSAADFFITGSADGNIKMLIFNIYRVLPCTISIASMTWLFMLIFHQ